MFILMSLLQDIKVCRDAADGQFSIKYRAPTGVLTEEECRFAWTSKKRWSQNPVPSLLVRAITSLFVPPIIMAVISVLMLGTAIMITAVLGPAIYSTPWGKHWWNPGGEYQSFIREGSAPKYNSLPLYTPILKEKVPLSYTF